ncbi:MAG: alpha-N-arabinofuranosidase [Propionicimonas sp.]
MKARLSIHRDFTVGSVDPRLFGSFVEHMGRCVYTGIFEPGHPEADEQGFRTDVQKLTGELGVSLVRYPGGNFVSGYRWEEGVGPVEDRPRRLDLAWRAVETNAFGLNEFVTWCRATDVEPMLAVNLGTRGAGQAAELVEYANFPGGSALSDLRRSHGYAEPHGIRLWCLGNEMDAPWQVGAKTADEYGRLATETAKLMRLVDPDIELVACGSSMWSMPTFGSWEATVLDHCFDVVDYMSLHAYYEELDGDLPRFLASGKEMDRVIEATIATIDHVAAKKRSSKTVMLAFDEWNVWFQSAFAGPESMNWDEHPHLIEDAYDVAAAVVVGSMILSLLRHADRVRIACQAQLANVIGAIRTEPGGPAWRQTTFYPFAHAAQFARGISLQVGAESPTYQVDSVGDVPFVDAAATWDPDDGAITLFMVNRAIDETTEVSVGITGFGDLVCEEHIVLAADGDARRTNSAEEPERVVPRRSEGTRLTGGELTTELAPLSWNVIRLRLAGSPAEHGEDRD